MITIKAYAKVNLSLKINGKREDGYHILDTVMQTVSIYDTVDISIADNGVVEVKCDDDSLCGQSNLCFKAARLFFDKAKIQGGCYINIKKRIPVSAGLGGGSSDAAAVIKGLNILYGQPLSLSELKKLALLLGADVPFFIEGGTARAMGIGEELTKINNKLPLCFLLVKEGEKPSTASMYKKIDESDVLSSDKDISDNMVKSLLNADLNLFVKSFKNDFSYVWDYEEIRRDLTDNGAAAVSLSGSGPTVMGVFKTKADAERALNVLKSEYSCIYSVETVNE